MKTFNINIIIKSSKWYTTFINKLLVWSYMLNETPLWVWIILEQVCCAHCNCMAGFGEVCTHIAAVLYLETITRIQGKQTCTQTEREWLKILKSIKYKSVKEIDFTSVKSKFDKMIERITSLESSEVCCLLCQNFPNIS